ncbi:ATP-binding cassette domain-containing protein [Candidatus Methylospira mobilis]|uniref:ABC transporter ATP-binding protein n=1 Tax=Candidatus Methylospira mobilis TaxID=1808979 RepID=UPI0028E5286B|nr:ATP-binding cassette domain-containing protein [Candidatus Methylospira mobilis]WNV05958.1 ATP-binding cassette domain-containing protein [Candidatus Methylospira mobilis]
MIAPAISVEHLTRHFKVRAGKNGQGWTRWFKKKGYDHFTAVSDLSFSIENGAKVAFIGPNGAGKSTTLKMLCGLLQPSAGAAQVCGYVPWEQTRALASRIGLVFGQRSHLWQALPVQDSFDLLAKIYDLTPGAYKSQRDKLVGVFGLAGLLTQPARTLSLGQRMRCDLAAALLHQPSVLFLDEPTIGLDVTAKALLRDHLNALAREFETTILLTSHDTDDIERICERVILIDHGSKLLDSGLAELRRDYTRFKTLILATEEERPVFQRAGVGLIEQASHRLVLNVDVSVVALEQVVSECLSSFKLQDISIENMPLEEVIKAIYARQRSSA